MINALIATTALNQAGLDAMGPASGQLSAVWATADVTYDADQMTLAVSSGGSWKAMVGGTLQWHALGAPWLLDAAGAPLSGEVAVLRFHPQAVLRLRRLIAGRFDGRSDDRAQRPVPACAAIRGGSGPAGLASITEDDPPLAPDATPSGTELTHGTLTFHDEQGLPIDPIAVACLYRDLLRAFPALLHAAGGTAADATSATAGTLGAICSLATGVRLHIVDPYGRPWTDRTERVGLRMGAGTRLGGALHDWPGGTLTASETDARDLRFGFSPDGTLGTAALSAPALPTAGTPAPALERQFFRVVALHLELHLLGNRSGASIDGVAAADEPTRLEPAPTVRDGDGIEFLEDGQAVMGAVTEITSLAGLRLAVSPQIADDVRLPADRTSRWPAAPAPTGTAEALTADHAARARSDATAAYVDATADVVVTWPAGALPAEAHVRVFPRVDPGRAIVPLAEMDFARRGDGGAVVAGTGAVTVVVRDPFRVGAGTRPADPRLRFDLLIVTRVGGRVESRLLGGLEVPVVTGGTAPAPATTTNGLAAVPLDQRGIAPAPVLGLPPTAPASGSDPLLSALGEAAPREAPRFRTMARAESVVAGHDGGSPGVWTAVLTPGFLNARSVRGDARLGNPGNDAGPEDHAPGIRATGRVAQDLARAALRRTHHLARRLPELDQGRWAEPPAGTGSIAGAVLQNIAQTCESPELSLLPESTIRSLPADWNAMLAAVGSVFGTSLTGLPAPSAGDRWVQEVRREAFAAEYGRRDSLWSWRWALAHARQLIYLETPLLGATGDVDLIAQLTARLAEAPDLRVIIALPRRIPLGPGYEPFAQRFHQLRNDAIASLEAAARKRVAVYHPVGFPGRPEVIRGTVAVVDDVWALVGSSSLSRRGLTFDGSSDVVLVDRALRDGASAAIRQLRRRAMARTLSLTPPADGGTPAAAWIRTRDPRSAFSLVSEVVARGGDGLIQPLWRGLPESELPALDRAIADPDGRGFPVVLGSFAAVLSELGDTRV